MLIRGLIVVAGILLSPAYVAAQPTGACTVEVIYPFGPDYPYLVMQSVGPVSGSGVPITVEVTKLTTEPGQYGAVGYTSRWKTYTDSAGAWRVVGQNLGGDGTYRVDYTPYVNGYCQSSPGWDCAEYTIQ